jgi:hypothetical protein
VQARFPKVDDRSRRAEFTWPDGTTATSPQYQHFCRLPHDLEHYAVDAVLRPRFGFWELAAAGAPFPSLVPVKAWPTRRTEWFATVVRTHRDEMVEAERLTGLLLGNARGTPMPWPHAQALLRRTWAERAANPRPALTGDRYGRLLGLHRELLTAWDALPAGEWLTVMWPPHDGGGARARTHTTRV